jgi:multidrug transporter EmrE-like cation transporter
LISALALIFVKKDKPESASEQEKENILKPRMILRAAPLVAFSAVFSGLSYLFQLIGASNLDAGVTYPLVTGGSIVFSSLAGLIVFKDKLSWQHYVGMALCVAGTCLFL